MHLGSCTARFAGVVVIRLRELVGVKTSTGLFAQHARLDQGRQSSCEHIGRDAQTLQELVEARLAGKGIAQDQDAPPLADLFEAPGDGAHHMGKALVLHAANDTPVTIIMQVSGY